MKILLLTVPSSIDDKKLQMVINEFDLLTNKLGFTTKLILLNETDLACKETERLPQMNIIDDIITICGNESIGLLNLNANFWVAISNGLGSNKKDTKIILNELIKGENIPIVKQYAKDKNISCIFSLAKTALGMLK